MNIEIVFQNSNWAVANKPPQVLSVPSRLGRADDRACLGYLLESQLATRVWPVHRLDYEVSGLILFALTPQSQTAGNRWFELGQIQKTYMALSFGDRAAAAAASGTWRSRLVRGKKRTFRADHGQPAVTVAQCAEQWGRYLVWDLKPQTGRPHQLRFEMADHGFPICGDQLYGGSDAWKLPGIALRAIRLDLGQIVAAERYGLPERLEVPGFKPVDVGI